MMLKEQILNIYIYIYFTTYDYNKFTSNIFDERMTVKKLGNGFGLNEKIKKIASKEEIKNQEKRQNLKQSKIKKKTLSI